MANKVVNLGENNQDNFTLAIEPTTGIPCWATQKDELWLLSVGGNLYDYAKAHPILLLGSNLVNRDEFTFTMSNANFDSMILSGQALYFRDLAKVLRNTQIAGLPVRPGTVYVGVTGIETDHMINAVFEDNNVRIDVSFK